MSQAPILPPETDEQADKRQIDYLREMQDLGMQLARTSAKNALDADKAPKPAAPAPRAPTPRAPDHHLEFARTTHAVRHAITLERRIRHAQAPHAASRPAASRYVPPDPRRTTLRSLLRRFAAKDPDTTTRNQYFRHLDEQIDDQLATDPAAERTLVTHLNAICGRLSIRVDLAQVTDAELDLLEPRQPDELIHRPADQSRSHAPPRHMARSPP